MRPILRARLLYLWFCRGAVCDGEFGYQAKAGVSYLASDNIDIFGEAIFRGTSGYSISNVDFDPMTAWGGQVGLRYRF